MAHIFQEALSCLDAPQHGSVVCQNRSWTWEASLKRIILTVVLAWIDRGNISIKPVWERKKYGDRKEEHWQIKTREWKTSEDEMNECVSFYLQTLFRAPRAGSWWRWGPRCRLCDRHILWPAGKSLWMLWLWNWTQSDTDSTQTLTPEQWEVPDVWPTGFLHASVRGF